MILKLDFDLKEKLSIRLNAGIIYNDLLIGRSRRRSLSGGCCQVIMQGIGRIPGSKPDRKRIGARIYYQD